MYKKKKKTLDYFICDQLTVSLISFGVKISGVALEGLWQSNFTNQDCIT